MKYKPTYTFQAVIFLNFIFELLFSHQGPKHTKHLHWDEAFQTSDFVPREEHEDANQI